MPRLLRPDQGTKIVRSVPGILRLPLAFPLGISLLVTDKSPIHIFFSLSNPPVERSFYQTLRAPGESTAVSADAECDGQKDPRTYPFTAGFIDPARSLIVEMKINP